MSCNRIVQLRAENVKRLSAVEITPEGDVVIVGGQNGAGKSSILDAIEMALGGAKAIPPEPIRRGQESARVVVDLDDLRVERRFWRDKHGETQSKLVVSSREGAEYRSPQKMLDDLVGRLAFDPLAFATMEPAMQRQTLLELLGLDFEEDERKRKELIDQRTLEGRELRALEGQLAGLAFDADAPEEPIAIRELLGELDAIERAAAAYDEREAHLGRNTELLAAKESELALARAKVAALEQEVGALADSLEQAVNAHLQEVRPDPGPVRDRMMRAEETNARVASNRAYQEKRSAIEIVQKRYEALANAIAEIDSRKVAAIREAKYPIDGLGVSDSGVRLNGMPFEQASQAERLRASVAIGLTLNPKLRVALIRDGSLMDARSMALIAEIAREYDAQLWVERVGSGDESAIIIEDGHVRE